MNNISTIDSLPNELIICTFDYLKPAEKFQSFFDYNDRFRKLVKHYVKYSHHALDNDITRFSTLHSWYKHLNFNDGGVTFYMIPLKGEQPRYNFDPQISDLIGIHWHFWQQKPISLTDKRIEKISQKYPIKLNPFFYPLGYGGRLLKDSPDFIRRHYPTQYAILTEKLLHTSLKSFDELMKFYGDDVELIMYSIYANEPKRLRNVIREVAQCIWREIQALEDVNILKIKYDL